MQGLVCSVFLLAAVTVVLSMDINDFGTDQEREMIIEAALSEAKNMVTFLRRTNQVNFIDDYRPISASMILARGFKKTYPRVLQAGNARIMMEYAVKRAEIKLRELKKKTEARGGQTSTKPGELLKKNELEKIFKESGCRTERDPAKINCYHPSRMTYRTTDGTCNNLGKVTYGASETEFRRLIPARYEDGISSLPGTTTSSYPSPRVVSLNIIEDHDVNQFPMTHMLMQWGQFLDHDMDLAPEPELECKGCNMSEICHNIPVPKNDPMFGVGTYRNGQCLPFRRSIPSCMDKQPGSFEPREQINSLTSYMDGSMVYGSTVEVEKALRLFKDGLLRSRPPANKQKATLPIIRDLAHAGVENAKEVVGCPTVAKDDCYVCGDVRCNEQVGLAIMHTIWMREHNRLAGELQLLNPHWTDERLYQEARAIVGAQIQKITYKDFLPMVIGKPVIDIVLGKYRGYNPKVDPSIPSAFATAAFRYGHSLVQPELDRLDANYKPLSMGPLKLKDAFFNPAAFKDSGGTDPVLLGLLNTNALHVDESVNSDLTNKLFENATKAGSGMDLASLNIQRSRDHGLPSYTAFKRFCQKAFPTLDFTEFRDYSTYTRLLRLYRSIDKVELWVGGLAEDHLEGSLLGPTFACLFGITFANVRDGDRFYFESREGKFTRSQISQIHRTSLSRVLCDNGDNIVTIQRNAFLIDQTRIRCRKVPGLNLEPWRERIQYFRLKLPNRNLIVDSYAFSSKNPSRIAINSNEDNSVCLPFTCPPGDDHWMLVVPRLSPNARDSCTIKASQQLQGNFPTSSYYLAKFCPMFFPKSGVYDSLAACQAGSIDAFSFDKSCRSPEKSQFRHNTPNNAEDLHSVEDFPQEVVDILKKELDKPRESYENNDNKEVNVKQSKKGGYVNITEALKLRG